MTRLGRSERFIPVDTEAIRPEDEALARDWAREHRFFAIWSPPTATATAPWSPTSAASGCAATSPASSLPAGCGADAVVTPV